MVWCILLLRSFGVGSCACKNEVSNGWAKSEFTVVARGHVVTETETEMHLRRPADTPFLWGCRHANTR